MPPYDVRRSPVFNEDLDRHRKKFRKIDVDLETFLNERLLVQPRAWGDAIPSINPSPWKARMPVPSANLGAQGGMRIVYDVSDQPPTVTLLRMYFHREKIDVTKAEIAAARKGTHDFVEAEMIRRGLKPAKG